MEILTNLQRKILVLFSNLPDKDAFYLTGGTALSLEKPHEKTRGLTSTGLELLWRGLMITLKTLQICTSSHVRAQ